MAQGSWAFNLLDVNATPLTDGGLAMATKRQVIRQLGGPMMIPLMVPVTHPDAAQIARGDIQIYLKGWRTVAGSTILRFYGPVWVDEIIGDQIKAVAFDQSILLSKRRTSLAATATDLGTMLKSMIDTTNAVNDTGIRTNASNITASTAMDYDASTSNPYISDVASQFASMASGCESWVAPIDLSGGKISDFYAALRRGTDRSASIAFEYGPDTQTNCETMGRVRNKANMGNAIVGGTDAFTSTQTDSDSITAFRRLELVQTFTNETSQTALDSRAQGVLAKTKSPTVVAEYSAKPMLHAPSLYDDYDVGDIVTLRYKKGQIEFKVSQRVVATTLDIDDNGLEVPSSVEFRSL